MVDLKNDEVLSCPRAIKDGQENLKIISRDMRGLVLFTRTLKVLGNMY